MGESDIWDYYRKCDLEDGTKRAKCLLCEQTLSYASTTHNLKSHLARLHRDEVTVTMSPRKRPSPRKNHSLIWQYFSKVKGADAVAVCNICGRSCSFKSTITNLRSHLARIHRQVYNEMVKTARETSNGDDEVYLEYVDGGEFFSFFKSNTCE